MAFAYNPRVWDEELLADLRDRMAEGCTLSQAAERTGKGARECDIALWTMVGRSLRQAAEIMGGWRA